MTGGVIAGELRSAHESDDEDGVDEAIEDLLEMIELLRSRFPQLAEAIAAAGRANSGQPGSD